MTDQTTAFTFKTPLSAEQKKLLARDLIKLRTQSYKDLGFEDFQHLKKIERWGQICSVLGYGTAWIIPNPVSAFLISLGNVNRWANVNHPVAHGGYDKIRGIPGRYTRKQFAKGWRRIPDWMDWIIPQGWHEEHNVLHHYRLGEEADPDNLEYNLEWLRGSKAPMWLRYTIVALFACVWKPVFYAQSTLKILRQGRAKNEEELANIPSALGIKAWSLFSSEGREYWLKCFLPYASLRFVLIPALFAPLGFAAVSSVFWTSVMAEIFTNLHSFLVIVPNHAGDDVVRFKDPIETKDDFYYRQIVGSVNYKTGSDFNDMMHGWLNYQIEHHLWPAMPLSQYQKLQPQVKAICEKHGLEYKEESVFKRLKKAIDIMVGKTSMLWDVEEWKGDALDSYPAAQKAD